MAGTCPPPRYRRDNALARVFHTTNRCPLVNEWSERIEDLRVPPGNRLEALTGDRKGRHSIRVNDQFRICFVWTTQGAKDVEIVDYH
ncbi:plasmid maintenance system killer protein [Burkholderiales bacterium GJ-E10]|nr:plasmid maintenance system killer protein [Burkholderiales bacterium GJ-E10]